MSVNHEIGSDGILRDSSGRDVGKIDYDGQVRDGWHDKGHVDSDGRYIDEYGRDMGWTTSGGGSSSSDVGSAIAGLAVLGIFAGTKYLIDKLNDKLSVEGGANQSRYIQLPVSKEKAFEYCLRSISAIKRCSIKEQDLDNRIIKARAGMSFNSWGEVISLVVTGDNNNSNIEIHSNPVVSKNVLDRGKNKRNVEAIAEFLLSNLAT